MSLSMQLWVLKVMGLSISRQSLLSCRQSVYYPYLYIIPCIYDMEILAEQYPPILLESIPIRDYRFFQY